MKVQLIPFGRTQLLSVKEISGTSERVYFFNYLLNRVHCTVLKNQINSKIFPK